MSGVDRREYRRRLARRPNAVRFRELERLLFLYDWQYDRSSGSHMIYRRDTEKAIIPFADRTFLRCMFGKSCGSPRRTTVSDVNLADQVQAIVQRPYHRLISGEPTEGYLAQVLELPGCKTAGETPEEALRLLEDAMALWVESALAHDDEIPEPQPGLVRHSA
jgi:predicted RNase H-like HicB family nuclease